MPYLTGLETRWRLGGDSSLRWLWRRLHDISWRLAGSAGSRGRFKYVRFFKDFFSLQQVSEMSPRRESASHSLVSRVAATDQSRQSWRCLLGESTSHFWSPESPELPQLISRGSRGDVSASEIGPLNYHFSTWNNLHSYYKFCIREMSFQIIKFWTTNITSKELKFCNDDHIVSLEPERRYHYPKMFRWEPEGRYRHRLCTAIAPFWFSMDYLWILIVPFWLSTDDI